MKIGLVQMCITQDKQQNLQSAAAAIASLASRRVDLVCLPEMFNYLGSDAEMRDQAEPLDGPSLTRLQHMARTLGVFLHCGSIFERQGETIYNTSVVFNREGEQVAVYRKLHLFDVEVPGGEVYRESAVVTPGNEIVTFDCEGIVVGLSICYDLRFPELYRSLSERGGDAASCSRGLRLDDRQRSLGSAGAGEGHRKPVLCGGHRQLGLVPSQIHLVGALHGGQSLGYSTQPGTGWRLHHLLCA